MVGLIFLKHVVVRDANVCGEARLSGVPFPLVLLESVVSWTMSLSPCPALYQFLLEALKMKGNKNAK